MLESQCHKHNIPVNGNVTDVRAISKKPEMRRQQTRLSKKIQYANETIEQIDTRRKKNAQSTKKVRGNEKMEQTDMRQQKDAQSSTNIRENETTYDEVRRRKRRKLHMCLPCDTQKTIKQTENIVTKFIKNTKNSADYVCASCHRLMYRMNVVQLKENNDIKLSDSMQKAITNDRYYVGAAVIDECSVSTNRQVQWLALDDADRLKYKLHTDTLLQRVFVPIDVILCTSATDVLKTRPVSKQYKVVPGWNDVCSDAHNQAREAFVLWCVHGKPKTGPIFTCMSKSRALFKYALRHCKRVEKTFAADKLAYQLVNKDYNKFWQHVKTINGKQAPIAKNVGCCAGHLEIVDVWRTHFSGLLNNSKSGNDSKRVGVLSVINDHKAYNGKINIETHEVQSALNYLKLGKAAGPDKLYSEHFKYAGPTLATLLSLLIKVIFVHGYMPCDMMCTTIIPLLKDKVGDITDTNNYRPIALATVVSKIIERIILQLYEHCLITSANQFSFKKRHSTDMAVFSLKETSNIYRRHSSPVFICFLDASKAFDKINHWILFDKLIKLNMPLIVVRLLAFWYMNQRLSVQWHDEISEPFTTSNGVKQGGILSPLFFNIYMDDLSRNLNNAGVGCYVNNNIVNHIMYADDMCLLAPSAKALQILIDECTRYAIQHDIVYNTKKSVCMLVKSKKFDLRMRPCIKLDNNRLQYVTSYKYLGCLLTETLCDNDDVSKTLRGIYARANMLIRRFSYCSTAVKRVLFQTFCTNFNCTQLWWSYTKSTLRKTKIAFNNSFRFLMRYDRFCSASGMFAEANVNHFDTVRRKCIFGFMCRLRESNNNIIKTLISQQMYTPTQSAIEWGRSLYIGSRSTYFD